MFLRSSETSARDAALLTLNNISLKRGDVND